jgi:hypothetical protein
MKSLEDMKLGHRIIVATVIVTVVLILLYILGRIFGTDEAAGQVGPTPYDQRLLELDRQAIDTAYSNRVQHMFEIWLQDPTGQPQRALVGVGNARRAYVGAMAAIDKRERELGIPIPKERPK